MLIDDQLLSMGFVRKETGGQVFSYVRDVGNGLSLVCHSEAGGMLAPGFGYDHLATPTALFKVSLYGSSRNLAVWPAPNSVKHYWPDC